MLHFKLRVLDLVEVYIKKESSNPLVLVGHVILTTLPSESGILLQWVFSPSQDLVVPLYELIHATQSQKEAAPLVKRVTGIFKNKLCHMKDVSSDASCVSLCIHTNYGDYV